MLMYENESYQVTTDPDGEAYLVVNKLSGHVEYTNTVLPKCIIAANEWNRVIVETKPKEATTSEVIPFKPR